MKSNPADFEIINPDDLYDATMILEKDPSITPIAGGTDLMVLFEAGKLPKGKYLNLWNLADLKKIELNKAEMVIGAGVTYSMIRKSRTLQEEFPMLVEAAKVTGAPAIQNRGTIGGNIVNASPAADSPPALLCYDTEVELTSAEGERWVSYQDFHHDYKKMDRKKNEILTRIRIKRNTLGLKQFYYKVGTRKAQAISKVCFAMTAKLNNDGRFEHIRIALGSVAPIPLRCFKTEQFLQGKKLRDALIKTAQEGLAQEINPIDDVRSTGDYRQKVAQNLLGHYMETLKGK